MCHEVAHTVEKAGFILSLPCFIIGVVMVCVLTRNYIT